MMSISDVLIITFEVGKRATGIVRCCCGIDNKNERKAVGITIFDYSVVAGKKGMEPPFFHWMDWMIFSAETREIVFEIC